MTKRKKKLLSFLHWLFAPRVTKTYYYNDKKVQQLPKEAQEKFDKLSQAFKEMDKIFTNL